MKSLSQTSPNKVIKHSAAVHISNQLPLMARKISNILLKKAFPKLEKQAQHQIHICELLEDLGWSNKSNISNEVKIDLEKLNSTQVKWNILGKDKKRKWGVSTLLAGVKIENNIIYYSYSEELIEWLSKPNIYTVLNLDYQKALKSKHSLALWEFCNEQLDTSGTSEIKTNYVGLSLLRELLGAEDETYNLFKYFNDKILKSALLEINSKTDLDVRIISTQKINRKISSLSIQIRRKAIPILPQLNMFEENMDIIELVTSNIQLENLTGKAAKLGLDEEFIREILKSHDINQVTKVLDFVLERIRGGIKINNINGYIWSLLDRGMAESPVSEEVYSKLLQLEDQQKQEDGNNIKQQIIKIIGGEQDEIRCKILAACAEVMHPVAFLKMAEIMKILKFEKTNVEIHICIFMNYKYSVGLEKKLEDCIIQKFLTEGKKTFVTITDNKPESKTYPV